MQNFQTGRPDPGIYVFHIWSFCAGRKTSTIGLYELCIIIICWIFCACTQILSRDVEDFCVHAQKFLKVILDNIVSKGAKIRNRHNQVPHLTQDTNEKVTNSQKTPQTRAKRSALSQQVTTKHI